MKIWSSSQKPVRGKYFLGLRHLWLMWLQAVMWEQSGGHCSELVAACLVRHCSLLSWWVPFASCHYLWEIAGNLEINKWEVLLPGRIGLRWCVSNKKSFHVYSGISLCGFIHSPFTDGNATRKYCYCFKTSVITCFHALRINSLFQGFTCHSVLLILCFLLCLLVEYVHQCRQALGGCRAVGSDWGMWPWRDL